MKPLIRSLGLALLTFIVGVALTFAWQVYLHTQITPVRHLPALVVSEIYDKAGWLDNKDVRIRGVLQRSGWGEYWLVPSSIELDGDSCLSLRIFPSSLAMSRVDKFVTEPQEQPFYEQRKGQEVVVSGRFYKYFTCDCILSSPGMTVTDIEPLCLSDITAR